MMWKSNKNQYCQTWICGKITVISSLPLRKLRSFRFKKSKKRYFNTSDSVGGTVPVGAGGLVGA
jgi:hypothetical protein